MSTEKFLEKFVLKSRTILQSNLIGVYLHGSLAMGCFNPSSSDVDLLILVKEKLTSTTKKKTIQEILQLEMLFPHYKIEMSILIQQELLDFKYPTPFELHYSKYHKEKYLTEENYLCEDDVDPDIAAHIVVTLQRGICLYGKKINEVFRPIDTRYYIRSIVNDLDDATEKITEDPVYYTLNLCRVLFYLKEGVVSSKKEGGEWALHIVPSMLYEIISICLKHYRDNDLTVEWDGNILRDFAEFMLKEINGEMVF